MEDDLATYKVYYEDPNADPNDPPFEEIQALDETDAMTKIRQVSDKDFTHAEFQDEELLQDE